MRRDLVHEDLVEAVIQLPTDMFFGAAIPACWLILNRTKSETRRGRLLFIDASELFERVDTKNVLRDEHIDRVVDAFKSGDALEGFSAWASSSEIAERHYALTVRRYVGGSAVDGDALSVTDALSAYREARERREQAESRLSPCLIRSTTDGGSIGDSHSSSAGRCP